MIKNQVVWEYTISDKPTHTYVYIYIHTQYIIYDKRLRSRSMPFWDVATCRMCIYIYNYITCIHIENCRERDIFIIIHTSIHLVFFITYSLCGTPQFWPSEWSNWTGPVSTACEEKRAQLHALKIKICMYRIICCMFHFTPVHCNVMTGLKVMVGTVPLWRSSMEGLKLSKLGSKRNTLKDTCIKQQVNTCNTFFPEFKYTYQFSV